MSEHVEELRATLLEIDLVDLTHEVLERAAQPLSVALSTLDALHLATALLWRERNGAIDAFATHGEALALAARTCGFVAHGA
jgi:predicted nucleic acid-binding protein